MTAAPAAAAIKSVTLIRCMPYPSGQPVRNRQRCGKGPVESRLIRLVDIFISTL